MFSAALTDILDALLAPANKEKLDDARKVAGNDMMKMMHHVFPLVTKIQQEVIQKHGFGSEGEGTSTQSISLISFPFYILNPF